MSWWTDMRLPAERELAVGFYDLRNYTAFCERTDAIGVLDLMSRYHALCGRIVHQAGGWLVKPIGDAGLFVFPVEEANAAVEAAFAIQIQGDAWLVAEGYPGRVRMAMHAGPVAFGLINGQLDVMGSTVNVAGGMRSEGALAITPALFRKLSAGGRSRFKKHTPAVTYIGLADPRPRG